MPFFQRALSLFRTLLRSSRLERDLDDELESVVQTLTEKHLRAGLDPVEARRQALLELGGVEHQGGCAQRVDGKRLARVAIRGQVRVARC